MKVDGSLNVKGSSNDMSYNIFKSEFIKNSEKVDIDKEIFEYKFSLINYISNFKKIFLKHYKNIDKYRETYKSFLKSRQQRNNTNLIGFLIHDDFFSPVTFVNNGARYFFSAHLVGELLNFILEHENLDFVMLYHNKSVDKPSVYVIRNNKESINYLLENKVLVDENTVFTVDKTMHAFSSNNSSLKLDLNVEFYVDDNNNDNEESE